MKDNQFKLGKLKQNIAVMKDTLPVQLANVAQNYFTASFTQQGWDGGQWKEVKRRIPGTPEYKYPKFKGLSRRTSPILVRTGALRRAVSNSIRSATWRSVRLVVDLPYAAAQNNGSGNVPQRKYMGNSPVLIEKQKLKIKQFVDKAWGH